VRRWIACRLEFKGWQRGPMMQPGKFTELFFLDEATAFAAGHRPCALCRREDYDRFGAIWAGLHGGESGADAIDLRLHGERVDPRTRGHRTHPAPYGSLPDAAFVLCDGDPYLVAGDELRLWSPSGYAARRLRPARGTAAVITPPSLVEVLRAGWTDAAVPLLHPSAR
jgi:streptogramin lyase